MADTISERKEAVLNDYLTEGQKMLMKRLMTERAPGIIDQCIEKPPEEISELDLDVLAYQIGKPSNRTEAELKGYLVAIYDSKKDPPEKKNMHLSETQQILVHNLREREAGLFKKYFRKPPYKITKADIANACEEIEEQMEDLENGFGLGIIRGYLLAVQDADFKLKEARKKDSQVLAKATKSVSEGLMDTGIEESMNDFALYDTSVDEMEWTDLQILPYVTGDRTTIYEVEPANLTLIAEGEEPGKDLIDLMELQVEHFHSILNAIRKEPAKYLNLKTGEFVSRKLAKLTVAVLNDIRAIDPDFEESIEIPGYKTMMSAELYKSARRCLKKESKGR